MSDLESCDPAEYLCRCEEVRVATVTAAINAGARTINDVKRRTRTGMGLCQGAFCMDHVSALLVSATGLAEDEIAPMTARPPVRLITLTSMAQTTDER